MADVTSEGKRLIDAWLAAKESLAQAKREVNHCECAEMNAHDALAKWLLPNDAKQGEKIAVWHGDSLFQVEVTSGRSVVTIRTRGRGLRS